MALAATTVWEVRATGNDNNGGGFNAAQTSAGTDYSQQDAPQLAATDLACVDTTTTLTSATGGFTAAMVGNVIQIVSGTNDVPGWYEITAYTNTNTVTIDRTCATPGSNMTSGVGNVGGALATPGKCGGAHVGGNTIWLKYTESDYSISSNSSNVANGRITLAAGAIARLTKLFGYNATRGDSGTRPKLKWTTAGGNNAIITGSGYCDIRNVILDGNSQATTGGTTTNGAGLYRHVNVKIMGMVYLASNATRAHEFIECEWTGNTFHILEANNVQSMLVHRCVFVDNASAQYGVTVKSQGLCVISGCLFDNNKSGTAGGGVSVVDGSDVDGHVLIDSCDFYDNYNGINWNFACSGRVQNCYCEANTGYGIAIAAACPDLRIVNCGGYNNATADYQSANVSAANVVDFKAITTGSAYVTAGTDFTKNDTPNRGALLRQAAWPSQFGGHTGTTNYGDIGAFRHQDPAGGGGGGASGFPRRVMKLG